MNIDDAVKPWRFARDDDGKRWLELEDGTYPICLDDERFKHSSEYLDLIVQVATKGWPNQAAITQGLVLAFHYAAGDLQAMLWRERRHHD